VWCSVVQCGAVWYGVALMLHACRSALMLHACRSALMLLACRSALLGAVGPSVVQCGTVCCSVLHCVAVMLHACRSKLLRFGCVASCVAVLSSVLQYVAVRCIM